MFIRDICSQVLLGCVQAVSRTQRKQSGEGNLDGRGQEREGETLHCSNLLYILKSCYIWRKPMVIWGRCSLVGDGSEVYFLQDNFMDLLLPWDWHHLVVPDKALMSTPGEWVISTHCMNPVLQTSTMYGARSFAVNSLVILKTCLFHLVFVQSNEQEKKFPLEKSEKKKPQMLMWTLIKLLIKHILNWLYHTIPWQCLKKSCDSF